MVSKKMTLWVFKELRKRLNGQCGSHCPNIILSEFLGYIGLTEMFCHTCRDEFNFLSSKIAHTCPCYREINPDELFLRLDEFLEELQDEITKHKTD